MPARHHLCFAVSPRPLTSPHPLLHNRQVLKEMGYAFVVIKPDIDEKAVRHSDPYKVPLVVARAKAKVRLPTVVLQQAEPSCLHWVVRH